MDIFYWPISYALGTAMLYMILFTGIGMPHKSRNHLLVGMFCLFLIVISIFAVLHFHTGKLFDVLVPLPTLCAIATLCSQITKPKSLLVILLCILMVMLAEVLVYALFYMFAGLEYAIDEPNTYLNLLAELVLAAMVATVITAKTLRQPDKWLHTKSNTSLLCLAFLSLISLCFYLVPLIMVGLRFDGRQRLQLIIGLAISCVLIFITLILNFTYFAKKEAYSAENKMIRSYIDTQSTYYETLLNEDEKARKLKHDMKAHLHCLQDHLANQRYEEALQYIGEFTNNTHSEVSRTGNRVVDTVINFVFGSDMDMLEIKGVLPAVLRIKESHLCIILSNLLQNAKREAKACEVTRPVQLDCKHLDNTLYISIRNKTERKISFINGLPVRDNTHGENGLGILNVQEVADKYNFKVRYKQEYNYFIVELFLYDII